MKVKLKEFIIKPSLLCTANCSTCLSRQTLHKNLVKTRQLSLKEWKSIIQEAKELGAKRIIISGGEPTLFEQLVELIKFSKDIGLFVAMNTNGGVINKKTAKEFLEAGLDSVMISLYSYKFEVHDKMKGKIGIWKQAIEVVDIFKHLKEKYPHFLLATQTIITKDNYLHFGEILEFHDKIGFDMIYISYLEGDHKDRKELLSINNIDIFKEKIPGAIDYFNKKDKFILFGIREKLNSLFNINNISNNQYSCGIYRNKDVKCNIPNYFMVILANGDVHPCSMIEYSHEPVIGNLFRKNLKDIWFSTQFQVFRKKLFSDYEINYCKYCPMHLHINFLIKKNNKNKLIKKQYNLLKYKFYIYKISPKLCKVLEKLYKYINRIA